jgi:lysophospholipase L1-like esterase
VVTHLAFGLLCLCMTVAFLVPAIAADDPAAQLTATPQVIAEEGKLYLVDPDIPGKPRIALGYAENTAGFAARDDREKPPQEGVLFIGSSTFTRWSDVATFFPGYPVVNRAFGGSKVWELWQWADRAVFPHKPKVIVVYIGDNDMASFKAQATPTAPWEANPQAVAFFIKYVRLFVERVQTQLPEARFIFVGVKPSVSRWLGWETVYKPANAALAQFCARDPKHLAYLDTAALILGADGKPRPELFIQDGLHLQHDPYYPWAELIAPTLARMWQDAGGREVPPPPPVL